MQRHDAFGSRRCKVTRNEPLDFGLFQGLDEVHLGVELGRMNARNDHVLAGEDFRHVCLGTMKIECDDFDAEIPKGIVFFVVKR